MFAEPSRKMLHTKRSFGKYPKNFDSPAYDASEEDNDPLTDDGASSVSVPVTKHQTMSSNVRTSHPKPPSRARHHLTGNILSDSDGLDSPTYDGDVESSATAGASNITSQHYHHHSSSSTSTLGTPFTSSLARAGTPVTDHANISMSMRVSGQTDQAVFPLPSRQTESQEMSKKFANPNNNANPADFTPEDIQMFIKKAIDGETWRRYRINSPPYGRPIRIYADGVYDLFHFGHALQLRQAKLSFPSVHLLVGVCSDELVKAYKSQGIMTHAERCEAARHCRWVDEVIPDAPWIINEEFLRKHQIDYVAHDEDPYDSSGYDDVYAFVKAQGKFIPTRRTPRISTSGLLERIVSSYRNRDFDDKLTKMGHAQLRAAGSNYDEQSRHGG